MIPIGLLTLLPYWLVWHEIALINFNIGIILISLIPSIIIHEGLHGVGYMLGGAKFSEVKFGFLLSKLAPYAHCKIPLKASSYRIAVALPGFILGILPLIWGLVAHSPTITFYSLTMILAAIGDLITLAMLLPINSDLLVQDHPSKPGFQVLLTH
ncbi:MAG: DUF3267 domain-containing protein [Chloroflexota bacterium]